MYYEVFLSLVAKDVLKIEEDDRLHKKIKKNVYSSKHKKVKEENTDGNQSQVAHNHNHNHGGVVGVDERFSGGL